ncbi:MAG: S8 family serine peptidase [Candidatus Omnitrophica bacterium]|nr:S8 family serine peptidase [Candidatus Omnitrophota bacterium]
MTKNQQRVGGLFFVVSLLFFLPSFLLAAQAAQNSPQFVLGEVLVKLNQNLPLTEVQQIAASVDAAVERPLGPEGLYLFRFDEGIPVSEVVDQLERHPAVSYAEPNLLFEVNDISGSGIDSSTAAPVGERVVVAILDTGIDFAHTAFSGKIFRNSGEIPGDGIDNDRNGTIDDFEGYDFYSQDGNPSGNAGAGAHGTQVAGRVLSGGLDAPIALMPLRVGPGPFLALSAIVEAIHYAADMGAEIINMSFGSSFPSRALADAVKAATERGVLLIAAAGNNGWNYPSYPAAFSNVVSVAASEASGRKASFSNYGSTVDFTATGDQVVTTTWGGGSAVVSGTSFSAPFLAGVAARILAAQPGLTVSHLISQLRSFAQDINVLNPLYRGLLGAGLINDEVAQAVAQALPITPPQPVEPPVSDEAALQAQLDLARQQAARLQADLESTQRALDETLGRQTAAEADLARIQPELDSQWRKTIDSWLSWIRSLYRIGASAPETVRLQSVMQVERDKFLQILARQREAQARLRVARAEAARLQDRRNNLAGELDSARRRVSELERLLAGGQNAAAQAQVQTLIHQRNALEELLRSGPLPEGLQASEVPEALLFLDSDRAENRD